MWDDLAKMAFREGDEVLIQMGKTSIVKLTPEERIELERIVLDQEQENAWLYLNDIIYPRIKDSIPDLDRIIKDKDFHSALKYIESTVYKQAVKYMNRPACKPVFELPKGESVVQQQQKHVINFSQ